MIADCSPTSSSPFFGVFTLVLRPSMCRSFSSHRGVRVCAVFLMLCNAWPLFVVHSDSLSPSSLAAEVQLPRPGLCITAGTCGERPRQLVRGGCVRPGWRRRLYWGQVRGGGAGGAQADAAVRFAALSGCSTHGICPLCPSPRTCRNLSWMRWRSIASAARLRGRGMVSGHPCTLRSLSRLLASTARCGREKREARATRGALPSLVVEGVVGGGGLHRRLSLPVEASVAHSPLRLSAVVKSHMPPRCASLAVRTWPCLPLFIFCSLF